MTHDIILLLILSVPLLSDWTKSDEMVKARLDNIRRKLSEIAPTT